MENKKVEQQAVSLKNLKLSTDFTLLPDDETSGTITVRRSAGTRTWTRSGGGTIKVADFKERTAYYIKKYPNLKRYVKLTARQEAELDKKSLSEIKKLYE